jgi:hypothetical protein
VIDMTQLDPPKARRSLRATSLALTALMLSTASAHGQERVQIRGQVVDAESRAALQGVLVTAPLSGNSVLTDSIGAFSLSFIEDLGYALIAEDMGYQSLRFTLGPEAAEALAIIALVPDTAMLSGLTALEKRLEQRRRRGGGGRIQLIEHDSLTVSTAVSAYTLVRRSVPMARPCSRLTENLCVPGGSRERLIRICIDDLRPPAGASTLESFDPADLWLVEIYNNGSRVRVYSRWFVDRLARTKQGMLSFNPPC